MCSLCGIQHTPIKSFCGVPGVESNNPQENRSPSLPPSSHNNKSQASRPPFPAPGRYHPPTAQPLPYIPRESRVRHGVVVSSPYQATRLPQPSTAFPCLCRCFILAFLFFWTRGPPTARGLRATGAGGRLLGRRDRRGHRGVFFALHALPCEGTNDDHGQEREEGKAGRHERQVGVQQGRGRGRRW